MSKDTVQLFITIMLLADLSINLITLLEFYWISLAAFLAVLLILPLSLLPPFPAGINALFSKEPRRASRSCIYALWNATSLSSIDIDIGSSRKLCLDDDWCEAFSYRLTGTWL